MYRLLLVDDDSDVLLINRQYFEKQGLTADTAGSAEDAVVLLDEKTYDCVVLDVKMGGADGYSFCRNLKKRFDTPVLFLTGLSEEEFMEKGFLSGGDDYLTKPYSLRELELRVLARIRSSKTGKIKTSLCFGSFTVDRAMRQAYINGQSLQLTTNEFEILLLLASNPGVPFTQEEIYQKIWGENGHYNSHSIQTLIVRIRRKISLLSQDRDYIKTAWGKGYLFCD